MSWLAHPVDVFSGGLAGDLFKGKPGRMVSQSVPRWSPEQQRLFSQMSGMIRGQLGEPTPRFPGQLSLGYTPEERSYFESFGPDKARAFWTGTALPEFQRQWREETAPAIRSEYAGPGFYGSPRMGAVSRAASEHESAMRSAYGNLMHGEEMARRGMLKERAGLSRQIGMDRLKEQFTRWQMGEEIDGVSNPLNSPYLEAAFGLLGLDPYYIMGGYEQPSPSIFESMAPGLGYAAGHLLFA
jgi:hypothetical protein